MVSKNIVEAHIVCSKLIRKGFLANVVITGQNEADVHVFTKSHSVVEVKVLPCMNKLDEFFEWTETILLQCNKPHVWVFCKNEEGKTHHYVLSSKAMGNMLKLVKEKQPSEFEITANEKSTLKPSFLEMMLEFEENWDVFYEIC